MKKRSFWAKAERPLIIIGTTICTSSIGFFFYSLREKKRTEEAKKRFDYQNKKKAEDRRKRREEEEAARKQEERQANEAFQNQVNSEVNEMPDPQPANVVVNSAPEDIKSTRLYGDLLHKGNIAVVYGPKGEGKSIFTTQMLAGITKGSSELLFPEYGKQHEGQDGIIIDFEQSPAQLKGRYGKPGYCFPDGLKLVRGKAFTKLEAFKVYLRVLIGKLTRSTVIAIDNLSKALPVLQDESTRDLFSFLSGCIESAKRDKGIDLTFVLVAHTNKEGYGVSIGTEHPKGTSRVTDYADLVIAIGPTKFGKSVKMLKVLNNRNEPEPETVLIMKKVDSKPYLHFERVREMREEDALPKRAKNSKWTRRFDEDQEECEEQSKPESMFTHEDKVEMWRMHKKEGLSFGKIAVIFEQRGKETTRQTIFNYYNEIDAEVGKEAQDTDPNQQH